MRVRWETILASPSVFCCCFLLLPCFHLFLVAAIPGTFIDGEREKTLSSLFSQGHIIVSLVVFFWNIAILVNWVSRNILILSPIALISLSPLYPYTFAFIHSPQTCQIVYMQASNNSLHSQDSSIPTLWPDSKSSRKVSRMKQYSR